MARQALSEAYRSRGRKGQALQVGIARERDYAADRGRVFVEPELRQIFELMASAA
ncbi:hypothetical protein [Phyllobacterium zundukense]|uniref:Uncharacterized protein n=1 Tax=Phyllobacterium zundukense TaxID=1867719 RepID=A0ACD4CVY3_9HYPH|nr:hypothetical protein [Phyllobacterium zundukense]UXN57718.1 hypothetical protein N8E88_02600 [Phyllobacterium zundukense]